MQRMPLAKNLYYNTQGGVRSSYLGYKYRSTADDPFARRIGLEGTIKECMDPSLAKCSRTLESVLRAYQMFAEKETFLVANMAKHTFKKVPCSAIAFRMVAHADEGKKVLEPLDVASTNSNCQREERARGTSPSFFD